MPTVFSADQAANESGTYAITVSFTDEDGAAVVPNSPLTWSLTKADRVTIVNSRVNVSITPASSITIVLTGDDLAKDAGQLISWRYLVIEGTYNSTLGNDLPLKDHLRFPIVDIAKVPD